MVSDNTATYESTPYLEDYEKTLLFEFNDYYNSWCDDNISYYEHLKKTLNILLFVQEDICRNKVLYTLCDKRAMIIDEGDKFYIGDLLDNILRDPLSFLEQDDFPRVGSTCNEKKEKQNQIQALRDYIVTSNDYRYYYIDETDDTVECIDEFTEDDDEDDNDDREITFGTEQNTPHVVLTVSQLI